MSEFRRVDDFLRAQAAARPRATGLVERDAALSYGDLDDAVDAATRWLGELGVVPGDRVMVVCENSIAAVILIFAALRRDAWAVPVNARLSAREIDTIRDHCRPRRIFYTVGISPDAAGHAERHGADCRRFPPLGTVAFSDAAAAVAADDPDREVAILMYTSGTTGAPKGVMLSHANMVFMARVWVDMRAATGADRLYCVLPISHIYGLANGVFGAIAAGASVELVARFDPADLYRALGAGITLMQGVPAMYARFLEYLEAEALALRAPGLRYVSGGGAFVDLDLKRRMEKILGLPFINGYGLTEASPTVSVMRIGDPSDDESAGPVVPETELRLTDPATGAEIAAEIATVPGSTDVGELWVRGPQIMMGYYRDQAATDAVLRPDGWFNTGDLARIDEAGSLWIVGRSRELIIRSGFNVFPAEVEGVLAAHPAVTLCGVVGRKVVGNEEVIAFVQLAPGVEVTPEQLGSWASERLAPYKTPSRIVIAETLPATNSGKVRKHELLALARDL
jgi:long-chain acyl-CoA synthetase